MRDCSQKTFVCIGPQHRPKCRLLCFPFAGGSSRVFQSWPPLVSKSIEIWGAELRGHGSRVFEYPHTHMDTLIEECLRDLQAQIRGPIALFGHSIGATIAFELARKLRSIDSVRLKGLFVSGCQAPHIPQTRTLRGSSDDVLLEHLGRIGSPAYSIDDAQLKRLILGILRADFEIAETYRFAFSEPLNCDLTVIGGADDEGVPPACLDQWRRYAGMSFEVKILPGNHFFIDSDPSAVCKIVADVLAT